MSLDSGDIRRIIDRLVEDRQRLRPMRDDAALHANRLALAYWQRELSRACARETASRVAV